MKTLKLDDRLIVNDARLWDPKAPHYEWRAIKAIQAIVVHHSAVDADSTVESIRRYHQATLGWPDCGYQFLAHWTGAVDYAVDVHRASYNVHARNREIVGICIPGDWRAKLPPLAATDAVSRIVAWLWATAGRRIPVFAHYEYALPSAPTQCPGPLWPQWKPRCIPVGAVRPSVEGPLP